MSEKTKKEEHREHLKSIGYDLNRKCGFCEKPYEGDDIRITLDKESNSFIDKLRNNF